MCICFKFVVICVLVSLLQPFKWLDITFMFDVSSEGSLVTVCRSSRPVKLSFVVVQGRFPFVTFSSSYAKLCLSLNTDYPLF